MEAQLLHPSPTQEILTTLVEGGWHRVGLEDWFYPPGASKDRALVRIEVWGGQFQLWRRPNPYAAWMIIIAADAEEFSKDAFLSWQATSLLAA